DIWIRGLAVFALVFVVALGTIGGCGGDSGPSSSAGSRNTKPVLTENDFAMDPAITADDNTTTIVKHLESPFHVFVEGEGDTGGIGIDILPLILSKTTDLTVCWVDENPDAVHTERNIFTIVASNIDI
ncbi:hypothetical protein MYX76_18800, partial [Desulfobacterota bacterium AH_259_B03_O07]|nr:hypothetical protein [Desulfobacterota bacterium AH_259_B03_O07]